MNPGLHRSAMVLLMIVALSLVAGIGMREPMPPDEPRFVLAARAMVESGDWLFPHRGRELYAEKPPMFMWMQAAAFELVRHWRVAFLLPSLLAAFATLWFVHDLARRLWNRRIGWVALFALFACIQFGLQAKRAQIDMVLVAMTTASLWALLRAVSSDPGRVRFALTGGFMAGLGAVTKGVGFLPMLLLPIAAVIRKVLAKNGSTLPRIAPMAWLAVSGFVLGALVWLAPMLWSVTHTDDPVLRGYANDLLFRQTGQRYANPWHHQQPFWYFAEVIFTLWLPGALLLPWLVPAWWRRIRRGDVRILLPLAWGVAVLLFFSASPGKREVYIFPALPAFCLAAAPLLPALLKRVGVRRLFSGWLWLLVFAAALGAVFFGLDPQARATALAAKRGLDPAVFAELAAWFAAVAVAIALVAVFMRKRIGRAVVLATALLWFATGLGFAPALSDDSSASAIMRDVGEHIGPDAELGLVAWPEQMLLQADRPVREFGFKNALENQWREASAWQREQPGDRWLLVEAQSLAACVDRTQVIDAGRSNRRAWLLVPAQAVTGDCGKAPAPDVAKSGQRLKGDST